MIEVRKRITAMISGARQKWEGGTANIDARIADHLVDSGVVISNEDGCEYCKEDREGCRTMFGAFLISNPFHGEAWYIETCRCKPRQIRFCPMCGRKLVKEGRA